MENILVNAFAFLVVPFVVVPPLLPKEWRYKYLGLLGRVIAYGGGLIVLSAMLF